MEERERKMFWVFTGSTVVQAEGLRTKAEGCWWFPPPIGYMHREDTSAFVEKVDAIRAGLDQLKAMRKGLDARIAALQAELP